MAACDGMEMEGGRESAKRIIIVIIRKVAAFIALSVNVVVSSSVHFLRFDFCPFQTSIRRKLLFRSEVDRPTPCGSAHRHTSNHHSPFTISTRPTSRLLLTLMPALCVQSSAPSSEYFLLLISVAKACLVGLAFLRLQILLYYSGPPARSYPHCSSTCC